jgi:hypothetical protein
MKKANHGYGTVWRVEYEWPLLNGAARRGHFDVTEDPPAAGTYLTILYDRDDPVRHTRYPLSLVKL